MVSNEFINEIIKDYAIVLGNEEWEELEECDDIMIQDASAVACIETLEESGFNETDIKQLFDGHYLHNGGMWGMIPHEATLYTNEKQDEYILILGVKQ